MRRLCTFTLLVLAAACGREPTSVEVVPLVVREISDADHNAGNQHFFWLPPIVSNPIAFNGPFDGSVSPTVRICEWTGSGCAEPAVAVFTTTTGPGSEVIRVVLEDEHYLVNWHTDQADPALDPTKTYRIIVDVEGQTLGHADVDVVDNGSGLKHVDSGEYIALLDGRTLPVKFRVEEGAVAPIAWAKLYSGPAQDEGATSVRQTPDGGFVAVGWTRSFGAGDSDFWILKLTPSGVVDWERSFGGGQMDAPVDVELTVDGGYVLTSYSTSLGAAGHEPLVLKLDAVGNVDWQHAYRTSGRDFGDDIEPTSDGGFILGGGTDPPPIDGPTQGRIIKLDAFGAIEWQHTYAHLANFRAIEPTADGGYVAAGGWDVAATGQADWWLAKLASDGSPVWQRTLGGPADETAFDVVPTSDGGYIAVGNTRSAGAGMTDAWVVRLDPTGATLWDRTLGGSDEDEAFDVQQTADGGFVFAGRTRSFGNTGGDVWVVKLQSDGSVAWQRSYDSGSPVDANWYAGTSVRETSEGGFIVAGGPSQFAQGAPNHFLILKLKADGTISSTCPASIGASTPAAPQSSGASVQVASGGATASTASTVSASFPTTTTSGTVTTICES